MNLEELSQIYYINKEIESLQKELATIKARNFYKSNNVSDMPKGNNGADMNLEYVSKVMELEDMIDYSLRRLQHERKRVEDFIADIKDPEARLIVRLRVVNNMGWKDIGNEVGMDRRTASRKFYDFFKLPTM